MGTTTAAVKDELAGVAVGKACCARAEVATVLRLAGGVSGQGWRVVVAAELDTAAAAQRLGALIGEVFGHHAQLAVLAPTDPRGSHRWAVRVSVGAASLSRRAGLVDEAGLAVRGLPPQVVAGGRCDAEAIWRGAVLACGSLSEPGKGRALTVACPGADGAVLSLALTGAARRLRVAALAREVRGVEQVSITDPAAITDLLRRLGAPVTARAWQERQARAEASKAARAARAHGLDDANGARSTAAARAAADRLTRALEILAADVPSHLDTAARMRIAHPDLSLARLGALCDPPLSKDAIAGRIRRVLAAADHRAATLGIPTATSLNPDSPRA